MKTDYHFDDFEPGQSFTTMGATVTEAQILDFALQYDPQPFHLDREAAERSVFGGLIASGLLTSALSFRLWYDAGIMRSASLGSPGMDEVRWLKPVRPGDTIHVVVEVVDKRLSRSKPDRGIVTLHYTVNNQDGDAVMSYRTAQIIARKAAAD